jgi:hypothetical protein
VPWRDLEPNSGAGLSNTASRSNLGAVGSGAGDLAAEHSHANVDKWNRFSLCCMAGADL